MSFLAVLQLNLLLIWCWDWGWDINIFESLQIGKLSPRTDCSACITNRNLSLVEMSAGHWFYVWRLWDLDPTSSPGEFFSVHNFFAA